MNELEKDNINDKIKFKQGSRMNTKNKINEYPNNLEADILLTYRNQFGQNLGVIWDRIENYSNNFQIQTEYFFILFREMLNRGYIKLQKDNKIIEKSTEEWEDMFRKNWPKDDSPYKTCKGDIIVWFISDAPAFAVWFDPETNYCEWST